MKRRILIRLFFCLPLARWRLITENGTGYREMGIDFRTIGFVTAQILILYAYLSYYGPVRPWVFFVEGFLMGILAGVLLLLSAPLVHFILPFHDPFRSAILKAALIERGVSYIFLFLLVHVFFSGAGVRRFVSAGIHYGAGFAFLENLIYGLNFQLDFIYIRFVSSVPMHLATCGVQAYFLGMARMYESTANRVRSYALAFVVPVILHGFYDLSCHPGADLELFTGPLIVLSVFIFEILFSRMRNFPVLADLNRRQLRIEDWFNLEKQVAYAKWILYSSGTRNLPRIPFFTFRSHQLRILISFVMIGFAIIYWIDPLWYRGVMRIDLGEEYRMAIFGIMPASFGIVFFVIGSVNSEYFRNKRLRIPVVVDVRARLAEERVDGIAYEIARSSMFIHSEDFFPAGSTIDLDLTYLKRNSQRVMAKVRAVVPNGDPEYSSGMIVEVEPGQREFRSFFLGYLLFRIRKGIAFFFNLSGSHRIRSLFVQPLTVMQNEREYRSGEVIFRQGEKGAQFFLIKKGRVVIFKELENGERHPLSELTAGSIFGEMALMSESVRSATAECLTDCVIAVAHRDHLDALMQANPEFVLALIRNLIQIIEKSENEVSRLKQQR